VSRNLEVGKVFSTVFAPDEEVGFRLAVAGSKGAVQIWVSRAQLSYAILETNIPLF
jgi:periodic tryptophan protein 1